MIKNILVTGANGQLGQCLRAISGNYKGLSFFFASHEDVDITSHEDVGTYLTMYSIDVIVNVAAYTNVDGAEDDAYTAERVNVYGPKVLAIEAEKCGAELIHISTDYVFDGDGYKPYKEDDRTRPVTAYGITKLRGEEKALYLCSKTIVIRTSWLYSEYGRNFAKTILGLALTRGEFSVVHDQMGSPTYAGDLADAIIKIIKTKDKKYGEIYNYSNEGECTWFDFANEIVKNADIQSTICPVASVDYPTRAKRPYYSVLSKEKIKKVFGINILGWKETLKKNFSYISDAVTVER